ncbi:MAG: hypothetical protein AB7O96_08010 [Pseudobdellovibrionaceae bacterium]
MKKNLLMILPLVVTVACENKKQSKPAKIITSVSKQTVNEESKIISDLESVGLLYDSGRRTFGSGNPYDPCDEKLLATLVESEAKLAKIEKALAPNESLYRDSALELFRQIRDKKETLKEINSSIQPYCKQDHAELVACLNNSGTVRAFINKPVSMHKVVHPLVFLDGGTTGVHVLAKDEGYEEHSLYSDDLITGSQPAHYEKVLADITTFDRLSVVVSCATEKTILTDVGLHAKATLLTAFRLGRTACQLLQAQINEAREKSKEDNTHYTVQIDPKQRLFCGKLLVE